MNTALNTHIAMTPADSRCVAHPVYGLLNTAECTMLASGANKAELKLVCGNKVLPMSSNPQMKKVNSHENSSPSDYQNGCIKDKITKLASVTNKDYLPQAEGSLARPGIGARPGLLFNINKDIFMTNLKLIDHRDGSEYSIHKVNHKLWIGENIHYDAHRGCIMHENNYSSYDKNGHLYNAASLPKVCIDGWRLPTVDEFKELFKHVKESAKSMNPMDILCDKTVDKSLILQFGGYGSEKSLTFKDENQAGYFWTSDVSDSGSPVYCRIDKNGASFGEVTDQIDLLSVRLVCKQCMIPEKTYEILSFMNEEFDVDD